jgi:hypothetical protein
MSSINIVSIFKFESSMVVSIYQFLSKLNLILIGYWHMHYVTIVNILKSGPMRLIISLCVSGISFCFWLRSHISW